MKSRVGVIFLILAGSVAAQVEGGSIIGRVRVQVAFVNGVCDRSADVRMMGRNGLVGEGVANDQCVVDFANIPVGTYHFVVSGQSIEETDTGSIVMDSTSGVELEVKVRRATDSEANGGGAAGPVILAADLAIPARAKKEFDKANELTTAQQWPQAIERLNKAIGIYPNYASAYNNLGAIYARTGDRAREREALEKALSINDHFAPAYVNVGRMDIATGDFPNAETALNRASALDPADPMTLVLLTYAEFMNRRFDETIATSRRAHTLQGSHAFVHQVAARAFEQKRQAANAIAELELFLKEEPSGTRAEIARKELKEVKAIPH
jgi:tetratricopeptide (TPR) repeat protein